MGIPIKRSVGFLNFALQMAQICLCYDHVTLREPSIQQPISLSEVKFRVLQNDQPGVMLAGTDVISSSDPIRTMMSQTDFFNSYFL